MDGVQGWTVESNSSDGGTYFLEPLEGFGFPTAAPVVASATPAPVVASPTPASVVVIPSTKTEPGINTVTFNRYSFSYSDTLTPSDLNTTITLYPANGPVQPGPLTQIDLYPAAAPPYYPVWHSNVSVRFYETADLTYGDKVIYEQLQTMLTWRPTLTAASSPTGDQPLPLLPWRDLSQVIRGHIQYVETETVTGISYVTYLSPGVTALHEDSYIYTFQGLSNDGSTYISVIALLHTSALPTGYPDYDTVIDNGYGDYLAAALNLMNEATPDQFTPNLNDLDAMMKTFEVK
jgi:hypothetical protein